MEQDVNDIIKTFPKEDILRMIREMKTLIIRYLGEGEMTSLDMLYEASLLLDNVHKYLLQAILKSPRRGITAS